MVGKWRGWQCGNRTFEKQGESKKVSEDQWQADHTGTETLELGGTISEREITHHN